MLAGCKLLHFVKEYEKINGGLAVTLNMHLHLHLKECVQNYCSIYGFWLFSFERYNGILGSYHTNKTVEIQIMCKFMTSGILRNMQYHLPEEYRDFFLQGCRNQIESKGTCPSVDNVLSLHLMTASYGPFIGRETVWADLTLISFECTYKLGSQDRNELGSLRSVYMTLYPKITEASLNLATLCKK